MHDCVSGFLIWLMLELINFTLGIGIKEKGDCRAEQSLSGMYIQNN
jgi:hypothetical protein